MVIPVDEKNWVISTCRTVKSDRLNTNRAGQPHEWSDQKSLNYQYAIKLITPPVCLIFPKNSVLSVVH